MRVARWGEDLVVRLPGEVVETLGLKEGDEVALAVRLTSNVTNAGDEAAERASRRAAMERLSALGLNVLSDDEVDPVRLAAIARLRARASPLPKGYRFDREEANAR
jgi:antitoxin MazE